MPPKQSNQKSSIQTHSADAFEPAPFDQMEHLKDARQKRQEKAGKKRGIVAYQIQLKQQNETLHGPLHLKSAIEQHAGTLSSVVTKPPDADTWEADPRFMPRAPAKERKQAEQRPMGTAQWQIHKNAKCVGSVPLTDMSGPTSAVAHLRMDATEQFSEFYQETMENLVIRAETVCTIAQPSKPMPSVRSGACVQLLDVSSTWGVDDEQSKIYIEHLCAADLGQHDGPYFGESTAIAYNEVHHLANSFHQRGVKKAKATCDPLVDDAVSIELGYSTMAGGSKLQMAAWRKGEAFKLRATDKAPELNAHAEVAAELAWEHLLRRFPKIGERMLTEAGKYGIYSTGFSKVTVAYDNPTNAHYDNNFGADVLVVFNLRNLRGGHHVMTSHDGKEAIVVESSKLGTIISGNHQHVLHGNLGTTSGGRIIFSFYLAQALLDRAPNRFAAPCGSSTSTWLPDLYRMHPSWLPELYACVEK